MKSLSTAALEGKKVLYWTSSFFSAASVKELSSIFFAGTADRNPSIRFAAASFYWFRLAEKTTKKFIVINGPNIIVPFTAKPGSPVSAQ